MNRTILKYPPPPSALISTHTPSEPAIPSYNKGEAKAVLNIRSSSKYDKLGLGAFDIIEDPHGHGGIMYQYRKEVIDKLAADPEEIKRRVKAFNLAQKEQAELEKTFGKPDPWKL